MSNIYKLLKDLEESDIAKKIGILHDTARIKFRVLSNKVKDLNGFDQITDDYIKNHNSGGISKDND